MSATYTPLPIVLLVKVEIPVVKASSAPTIPSVSTTVNYDFKSPVESPFNATTDAIVSAYLPCL